MAASKAMSELCEGELAPGPDLDDGELQAYARRWVGGYWHPVGTCKMGPETDPDAVVDHNGCVHGFDNLFVADARSCRRSPVPTPTCPCWRWRSGSPKAARRAGLEDVEKSLRAPSTAWTRRSGTQSMLRVPLVASTGRTGYSLELLVALVVAVTQRRLGPSSSARTSTVSRRCRCSCLGAVAQVYHAVATRCSSSS